MSEFVDDVEDVVDRTDDLPQDLLTPCGTAEVAFLAMQAGFLQAFVQVDAVEDQHYVDVAEAGNDWLNTIPEKDIDPFPTLDGG